MGLLFKYGAQPDLEDEHGSTPLSRAVEKGSAAIVQLLLAQGAKMNYVYNIVSDIQPNVNKSTPDWRSSFITACKSMQTYVNKSIPG